jgi:hypothetical protein
MMIVRIGNQTLQGMINVELNYPGVGACLTKFGKVLDYAAASVTLKASGYGEISQSFTIGIRQLLLSSIRVEQYGDFYRQAETNSPKWDSMRGSDAPWYAQDACEFFLPSLNQQNRSIFFHLKAEDDPGGKLALQYELTPERGADGTYEVVEVWERAKFAVALYAMGEGQHGPVHYLIDHMFWDFSFHCTINRNPTGPIVDWARTWMGAKRMSAPLPRARGSRTANSESPEWKKRMGRYDGW